jgi:hypothetical protein
LGVLAGKKRESLWVIRKGGKKLPGVAAGFKDVERQGIRCRRELYSVAQLEWYVQVPGWYNATAGII